jgi:hypothetical protein
MKIGMAQVSERERRKWKMLLFIPLVAVPLFAVVFHALGGGGQGRVHFSGSFKGINMTLPEARLDGRKKGLTKLGAYGKAERDSARLVEKRRNDPYYSHGTGRMNQEADSLLGRLEVLKEVVTRRSKRQPVLKDTLLPPSLSPPVLSRGDPDLDKLNGLLEKVIRIQHPLDTGRARGLESEVLTVTPLREESEEPSGFMELDDAPQDTPSEQLTAVVDRDQTLVSGESVELRLGSEVLVSGVRVPMGTLVTGVAALSGERLSVLIRAIRVGVSVLPVSLEVVDMDGIAGIRVPGSLNRDVAKESADEAMNTLGVTAFDPTLGGQAAAVGLQAAKSLLGRKVRLVRVSLPAGYRVLLRNKK